MNENALTEYDRERARAKAAREEARYLRDLHRTATCGLPMKYTGIHYGTAEVRIHIAARVADQYLGWADEYDAIADAIEEKLTARLAVSS
jgi:hypothetical protein